MGAVRPKRFAPFARVGESALGSGRRGRYLGILALLLLALLVAGNLTGFLLYRSVRREIDSELGERLISIATTAAQAIGSHRFEGLTAGAASAGDLRAVQTELEAIALANDLDNIVLLDHEARSLVDLRGGAPRGAPHPLQDLDPALDATLVSGLAQSNELVPVEGMPGQFLKAGYAAFESDSGRVLGVIAVEGGSTFFRALTTLRVRLIWAASLGTLAVLVLGVMFFRILYSFVKLEDSLRRSAALLAIGQISALVAHEIKNPLAIIRSRSERVRAKIVAGKDTAEVLEWFEAIPAEVDRLNQILTNYLSLASPDQLGQGECEPARVIEETLSLLESELLRRGVKIERRYVNDGTVSAPIGARSLKQVLLNLILNAAESMESGGTIRIELERRAHEVELAIEDEGSGMSDDVRRRALEPFFTTKATGSGLGLTLVASLIAARGGELRIQSIAPRGTRMRVILPLETRRTEEVVA